MATRRTFQSRLLICCPLSMSFIKRSSARGRAGRSSRRSNAMEMSVSPEMPRTRPRGSWEPPADAKEADMVVVQGEEGGREGA